MNTIDYSKLEQILQKVGYSDSEIGNFRKKFTETFCRKIGVQLDKTLTESQKDDLEKLLSDEKVTVGKIIEFFRELGFEAEIAQISQEVFEEMAFGILEKMVELASDDQRKLMKQVLLR